MGRSQWWWRIGLLALPLGVYGAFVVWPLLSSFAYSATNWNGFARTFTVVGLDNFRSLARDPLFAGAMRNTLIWTVAAVLLPNGLGFLLALGLERSVQGSSLLKSVFYLPVCLSAVVVGQIWIWIYRPDWGVLNTLLGALGFPQGQRAWLAEPKSALFAIIAAWSWQQTGLSMVIYLSGLTNVPHDLLEAAALDGASYWGRLRHIVMPMLTPATIVVIALSVITSLKNFDIVYIMTGGNYGTEVIANRMYQEQYSSFNTGRAAAIAVVLIVVIIPAMYINIRRFRAEEAMR